MPLYHPLPVSSNIARARVRSREQPGVGLHFVSISVSDRLVDSELPFDKSFVGVYALN